MKLYPKGRAERDNRAYTSLLLQETVASALENTKKFLFLILMSLRYDTWVNGPSINFTK